MTIWRVIYILMLLGYIAYFSYAMYYHYGDEGSERLLWVTCVVVAIVFISYLWKYFGESISEMAAPAVKVLGRHEELISW